MGDRIGNGFHLSIGFGQLKNAFFQLLVQREDFFLGQSARRDVAGENIKQAFFRKRGGGPSQPPVSLVSTAVTRLEVTDCGAGLQHFDF